MAKDQVERRYLIVYNTFTGKNERGDVSLEIYQGAQRSAWRIRNGNRKFSRHEILFGNLTGGEANAYENFKEFMDTEMSPDVVFEEKEKLQALYAAIHSLSSKDQALINALFFEGLTERGYAARLGVQHNTIHKQKLCTLMKLKNLLKNFSE